MKTTMKTTLFQFLGLSLVWISTSGQSSGSGRTRISVETDPATFVFGGYALHLRIQPKNSDHLLLGAGIYAMDMPSFLTDLNADNRDAGWDVRIDRGYGLFAEYHFREVNKGFLAGTQLGIQEFKLENEMEEGSASWTNSLLMLYGGYSFKPFGFDLYLKPWAGLGYVSVLSGDSVIGDREYNVAPITMFATLHIGYTF